MHKVYIQFFAFFIFIFFCSCEDATKPKSIEDLLTGSPWQVEELRTSRGNTIDVYKRGATTNTVNYDAHFNTFDKDGKGFVYGGPAPAPMEWHFIGTDKSKIALSIRFPSQRVNVTWEDIEITEKQLRYTEYYQQDGYNILTAAVRTPKKN